MYKYSQGSASPLSEEGNISGAGNSRSDKGTHKRAGY